MGCISSKVITRSSSYHQETAAAGLNQLNYFQRREINGNFVPAHVLPEEFMIPENGGTGGDHLLALAAACCNINTAAKTVLKINHNYGSSGSSDSTTDIKPLPVDPINPETINCCQTIPLMAGLEQHGQAEQQQQQRQQQQSDIVVLQSSLIEGSAPTDINRRSKSFHSITEDKLSPPAGSLEDNVSNKRDNMAHGFTRSRSYHALEEYEAMIEKKRLPESQQVNIIEDSITDMKVPRSSLYHCGDSSNKSFQLGESRLTLETKKPNEIVGYDWSTTCTAAKGLKNDVPAAATKGRLSISGEKAGFRRKAMAKELASLSIPSCNAIELFPAAAAVATAGISGTLANRVAVGTLSRDEQVEMYSYCDANYVTPKFGSFCLPVAAAVLHDPTNKQRKINEDTDHHNVFELEIVAAFEEAMHQLQVEEDCVLEQINGGILQPLS